jgi:beta-aspartyl-peptidase (threonine type)
MPFSEATEKPGDAAGAAILLHGGAWDIPPEEHEAHLGALREALQSGRLVLQGDGGAVDAAAAAVASMESSGTFDAGRGGVLNLDGEVELDCGIMCGKSLDYGAVVGVKRIENPVLLARLILQKSDGAARILTCEGAQRVASENGFTLVDKDKLITGRERSRFAELRKKLADYHTSHPFLSSDRVPRGTVGCVARDRSGGLAAATSTGGTPLRPAGRVGDSALPGAGYFASSSAACSATGWGEAITASLLAGRSVDGVGAGGAPAGVLCDGLERMETSIRNRDGRGATGGLILLDSEGAGAWAFTTPHMARAGWAEGGESWAAV